MRIGANEIFELAARLLLGAPSDIVELYLDTSLGSYGELVDHAARIISGADPGSWLRELNALADHDPPEELVETISLARLRSLALGADDSRIEFEEPEDEIDEPDAFARDLETLQLRKRSSTKPKGRVLPWLEVLEEFLDRGAVTRDVWDVLEAEERRTAFTVAYQSSTTFVSKIQEVVARGLGDGLPVRDVVKKIRAAGERITASHAETVYRNAVLSAYARGRAEHMTQPHVVAARPWWQVRAVDDERTRKTHLRVNGWVMRADDPGWQASYPPFGHRCRCRCVARSEAWVQRSGATVWYGRLPNLPDRGWTTTGPPIPRAA